MNEITHRQAKQYMLADLDGLLTSAGRLDLETHLRACETCRAESESFAMLTARLQTEFHARWDAQDGPSEQVLKNIHARSRRIKMSKQVDFAFNLLGGLAAVLVVGFIAISLISQFQKTETISNGIQTNIPAYAPQPEDRLIAFASAMDGDFDIYTMRPDGSGLTNLTNNPARDINPAWSPDGKRIAFQSNRNGFMQIFLMNADGSNITPITDNQADHALTLNTDGEASPWSPDGSKLTMIERRVNEETWDLYVININTATKVLIANGKISLNGVTWSPNGNFFGYVLNIATGTSSFTPDVYVVNADGSNPRDLKELVPPDENPDANYYWSPDGYTIAFTTQNNRLQQTLYEYDLQTGTLAQKTTFEPGVMIDWQENLYLRFQTDSNGQSSLVWQSPVGAGHTFEWDNSCWEFDVTRSHQGNFAIGASCSNKQFLLYWASADGSEVKQILDMPIEAAIRGQGDIIWSPDDQYVALHIATASQTDLYILDVSESLNDPSTQPVKMTIGGGELYYIPSWQPVVKNDVVENTTPEPEKTSANNRLLAFTVAESDGNTEIYTMRADGSELTNLTDHPALDRNPAWSPDGKRIAFESNRAAFTQIYLMDVDGSNVTQLTFDEIEHEMTMNYANSNPWSPDGSHLLFFQRAYPEKGSTPVPLELYSIDVNTGAKIILASGDIGLFDVSWSPDGKHVAFTSHLVNEQGEPRQTSIQVVNADGSNLVNLTESLPSYLTPELRSWSNDGQSIIFFAHGDATSNAHEVAGFKVYEARLDGSLIEHASGSGKLLDWWDGISLFQGSSMPELTWVHGGTFSSLQICPNDNQAKNVAYTRSTMEQLFFGVQCSPSPGEWKLYLSNRDGSIVQTVLDSPLRAGDGVMVDQTWSPDDNYIAFNISSRSGPVEMFVLDVAGTLNDPTLMPVRVSFSYAASLSWQPISTNAFVEEEPVPETETTLSSGGLIAFTVAEKDGNTEIYTMRADGSELTNLTDHPALDRNPAWSPDGKRIAFESNRAAFTQIYLMDADGSNVTQLTFDEIEHEMTMNYANSNPWSPDGSHLLFFQRAYPEKGSTPVPLELYSMDVNSGNKVLLASGNITSFDVTWSPDGRHVAYIATNPQNPNASHIYVVDADGSNHRDVTKSLPAEESPGGYFSTRLYWARDGQSIFFIASNYNLPASWGSDNPLYWKVYESSLGGSLTLHATTRSPIGDWWDGVYFVTPFMGPGSWTWVYPDGTFNSINPTKDCKQERLYDPSGDSYTSATANFNQSPNGNGLIIARCPDGEAALSLVNSTGTEIMPLAKLSTAPEVGYLDRIQWSQDDRFVAFILASSNKTEMYIINIAESLKDPSIQPVKADIVGEVQYYSFSWQPIP